MNERPFELKEKNLSSAEKTLQLLLSFSPGNPEMGTLELSKKLGIHKSTVSRLLHLLTAYDFLQQNPDTKKYFLGRSAAEIGNAATRSLSSSLVSIAQPHLDELSKQLGESVALEMLSGTDVILAWHVEGQKHIRFTFNLGELVPINVAAGAKSMLAYCSPEMVDRVLSRNRFAHFNENTIMSKKAYRALLEEVRKTGIAYDRGERYEDAYAVATPIFNHQGLPVAAVVVAGPASRMTESFLSEVIPSMKKTAADISQRLYH